MYVFKEAREDSKRDRSCPDYSEVVCGVHDAVKNLALLLPGNALSDKCGCPQKELGLTLVPPIKGLKLRVRRAIVGILEPDDLTLWEILAKLCDPFAIRGNEFGHGWLAAMA